MQGKSLLSASLQLFGMKRIVFDVDWNFYSACSCLVSSVQNNGEF